MVCGVLSLEADTDLMFIILLCCSPIVVNTTFFSRVTISNLIIMIFNVWIVEILQ